MILAVLLGEARADIATVPATAARLELLRKGKLESFIDPRRGVSEIVFTTDIGDEGPAPKWATHRCGKALTKWLDRERSVVARAFDWPEAGCERDVCSGPNTRTEEWGLQTALYFRRGHLFAVVQTSQYQSASESDLVDAFVDQELKRAARATCR